MSEEKEQEDCGGTVRDGTEGEGELILRCNKLMENTKRKTSRLLYLDPLTNKKKSTMFNKSICILETTHSSLCFSVCV